MIEFDEKGKATAEKSARAVEQSYSATADNMRDYSLKIIDMAHANTEAVFEFARRSVARERRPCCGQLLVHFAAPGSEKTQLRAWPMPPSFRPLLSRPARSGLLPVRRR